MNIANSSAQKALDRFLTAKETGNVLHLSPKTLRKYTKQGLLIGCKIGNRILYRQSDVVASLKVISEQEAEAYE